MSKRKDIDMMSLLDQRARILVTKISKQLKVTLELVENL